LQCWVIKYRYYYRHPYFKDLFTLDRVSNDAEYILSILKQYIGMLNRKLVVCEIVQENVAQ